MGTLRGDVDVGRENSQGGERWQLVPAFECAWGVDETEGRTLA